MCTWRHHQPSVNTPQTVHNLSSLLFHQLWMHRKKLCAVASDLPHHLWSHPVSISFFISRSADVYFFATIQSWFWDHPLHEELACSCMKFESVSFPSPRGEEGPAWLKSGHLTRPLVILVSRASPLPHRAEVGWLARLEKYLPSLLHFLLVSELDSASPTSWVILGSVRIFSTASLWHLQHSWAFNLTMAFSSY